MHYAAFTELLLLYVSVHVPATVNTAAVHAAPGVQKFWVVPYPLQSVQVSDVRMLITCVSTRLKYSLFTSQHHLN